MTIEVLNVALQHVKNFDCVIDGGANIGEWVVELAPHFDTVIAFEPGPAFADLKKLRDNGKYDNVAIHNVALGESDGIVNVCSTTKKQKTYSNFIRPANQLREGEFKAQSEAVTMQSIDTTMKRLSQKPVGLIKLDLEGYEYFAIQGAKQVIDSCTPVFVVEFSLYPRRRYGLPNNQAAGTLLEGLGYQCVAEVGNDSVFVYKGLK